MEKLRCIIIIAKFNLKSSLLRAPNWEFLKLWCFWKVSSFKAQILLSTFKFIQFRETARTNFARGERLWNNFHFNIIWTFREEKAYLRILRDNFLYVLLSYGKWKLPSTRNQKFLSFRWQLTLKTLPETVLGSFVCFSFLRFEIIKTRWMIRMIGLFVGYGCQKFKNIIFQCINKDRANIKTWAIPKLLTNVRKSWKNIFFCAFSRKSIEKSFSSESARFFCVTVVSRNTYRLQPTRSCEISAFHFLLLCW